jgi:hypothetical protein
MEVEDAEEDGYTLAWRGDTVSQDGVACVKDLGMALSTGYLIVY